MIRVYIGNIGYLNFSLLLCGKSDNAVIRIKRSHLNDREVLSVILAVHDLASLVYGSSIYGKTSVCARLDVKSEFKLTAKVELSRRDNRAALALGFIKKRNENIRQKNIL